MSEITRKVHVFRESSEWDRPGKIGANGQPLPIKWWELRKETIEALHIETWTITGEDADFYDFESLRGKYEFPVVLAY